MNGVCGISFPIYGNINISMLCSPIRWQSIYIEQSINSILPPTGVQFYFVSFDCDFKYYSYLFPGMDESVNFMSVCGDTNDMLYHMKNLFRSTLFKFNSSW